MFWTPTNVLFRAIGARLDRSRSMAAPLGLSHPGSSSPCTSFQDRARGEANGGVSPEGLCESKTLCETEEEPAPEAESAEAALGQLDAPPKWLAKVVSLKSQKRGRRRCPPALPAQARYEFMVSGRAGGIYLS